MASSGNFATWNGVVKPAYTDFEHGNTKSDGNTASDAAGANSSIGVSSGKWYMEMYLTVNTTYPTLGLSPGASAGDNRPYNQNSGYLNIVRYTPGNSAGSRLSDNSAIFTPASFGTVTLTQTNVDSAATGDIIGFALDVDNRKLWISKNGTFFNSGDPAAGSNEQISWTANPPEIFFQCQTYTGGRAVHGNWGQDSTFAGAVSAGGNADGNGFGDFKYAPPTGFLALCTANLPISADIDPAQTDDDYVGGKQFNTVLYTGNGSSNAITGLGFQPDLVWAKSKSSAQNHVLLDSSRGQGLLFSSLANAEQTSGGPFMTSYDSDGFTYSSSGSNANDSGQNYVAWCWRANGGTTASNTEGTTTSTVQANTKAGFSIIQYAGNSSSGSTIGHGLDSAPDFILFKARTGVENWAVYHRSLGGTKALILNTNSAAITNSNRFNDTDPSATLITMGNVGNVNESGKNYVAYAWHDVEGFQKFGNYIGNGNADGPFIYTGFRPRLLVLKRNAADNWFVFDSARDTFNVVGDYLLWDASQAESASSLLDFTSNGFKLRSSSASLNPSGNEILYMAWGDVPFKYNNTF